MLPRSLKLTHATAIVIGTIIGTGIFLKPASMAQSAGSFEAVMLAWVLAGFLSFTGALTYAEIGAKIPETGGEYAYLKHVFGKFPAFLFGWMRFWIASPASIAAYGVGAATFLNAVYQIPIKVTAISFILIFTLINSLTVIIGARVQTMLTLLKVIAVVGITVILFLFIPESAITSENFYPSNFKWNGFGSFGAAMLAALWAYDGWNNLAMVGGEIENPQKNIPRALFLGMFVVLVLYLASNISYFYALNIGEIAGSNSSKFPDASPVAALALSKVTGREGVIALSIIFVISALGAMNGSILTGARVPYAMAQDGLFFNFLGSVSKQTNVPVTSVLVQGLWACILALSGTFDQLTDSVVFASWIFYALTASAVFKMRKSNGPPATGFKTPGYPFTPALFVILSTLLLINTVMNAPGLTLLGLSCIGIGIPFYYLKFRKNL